MTRAMRGRSKWISKIGYRLPEPRVGKPCRALAKGALATLSGIRLPAPVMEDKIEATYHDGLLTVHLPEVEPAAGTKSLIK